MERPAVPQQVLSLLEELLTAGFTGTVRLDFKDGRINTCEKTERVQVQAPKYGMQ